MRDAHSRICGVYMLSTLAAGTISIDAKVFLLHVDLDGIVDLRGNKYACKRGVPPLSLVEWRDAHETVNANLAGQQAKGIFTSNGKRGRFNTRLLARLIVIEHRTKTLSLGPTQVHPHEHLCPVLRLGAPSARVDRDNRIARIVLPGKQCLGFQSLNNFAQTINLLPEIIYDRFTFSRQVEISLNIA